MLIVGLAVATTEHHAVAVVLDGQLVVAVEEERFNRIKHYGAHPRTRPDANLINDTSLTLREVIPRQALRWALAQVGATSGDVDVFAINGIPARFRSTYSTTDPARPPHVVRQGRYVFVPHHLAHAASAWRLSGLETPGVVVTVDGRGERETAAVFDAHPDGRLERRWDVLVGEGHSFGGCYETLSRRLGFGPHGQGAVMALAAMGSPSSAFDGDLFFEGPDRYSLDERALWRRLEPLERTPDAPLLDAHRDAAASVQHSLERALVGLVRFAWNGAPAERSLALAGGVALNCPSNTRIVRALDRPPVFVQPAAHDAGTAIGAALEAAWRLGEPAPEPMRTAALGPRFDDAAMEAALRRAGLPYVRVDDVAGAVAERLADGRIVCRFDGRMEVGPRALGQRSILADPRRAELKARLNAMKGRASWRPFGPSILADRQREWLQDAWPSPFMLFTFDVRPERRAAIPVVVHADGSTRPQSVDAALLPDYAGILEAFEALTGVPMVVNTSFNRGGEPIVCTPDDAVACFLGLGADGLQMGNFLVDRPKRLG